MSPHLLSVTDSVTVNGIPISAEEFAMLKEEVLATQGSSGNYCSLVVLTN